MPVFNLALEFDDKGALIAVRKLDDVAVAAEKAKDAVEGAGKSGARLKEVQGQADKAAKSLGKMGKALSMIGRFALPTAIVGGFAGLLNSAQDMAVELGKLEKQYQVLGARAGYTAQEMQTLEQTMIKNGIDAVEARKGVMTLTGAFISSSKALPLFSAALDASVLSGKKATEVMEVMAGAIVSGNEKMLSRVGLSADFESAYKKLAESLGTVTVALTEQEKAQARVDATLEAAKTNAGLYEQTLNESEKASNEMAKALTDLKTELANAFSQDSVNLVYTLASAIDWLAEKMSDMRYAFKGLGAVIRGELSLGQYATMDFKDLKQYLVNFENPEWVENEIKKTQERIAKIRNNPDWHNYSFGGNAASDANMERLEAQEQAYLAHLRQARREHNVQVAKDDAKAKDAERQVQERHNAEMLTLAQDAEKKTDAFLSGTAEARKKKIQKEYDDTLALQKRLLAEGKISNDQFGQVKTKLDTELKNKLDALTSGGKKSGSRSSAKIGNAQNKLADFSRQIEALNDSASKTGNSLEKALQQIADTGKAAGLSAAEIEKMQEQYATAFDNKTLKELNKELLQAENNTRALREIEQKEKVSAFNTRLSEIRSLSEDEKNLLLGRYQEAVRKQEDYKDLQTSVKFLEEMVSLGGDYGAAVDQQNLLIAKQADLYRDTLPVSLHGYISEWERLQRLQKSQSGWDGMIRGARKFGAEYGNMAAQVEVLTTQFGSHISNTLADAFMKGKLSMGDFFNSMIAMAAQAASNAFIGQIFSGIGGLFTSGSSITTKGFTNADLLKSSWGAGLKLAKGGVASGGNLSDYSGKVVTSPTLFAYDRHLSAFANGAGLMGEAGPEAIMPLARTTRGDLGVRMVWGEDMAREAYHTDDWKRQRGFSDNTMRMIADMQAVIRRERQSQMNAAPQITINVINNSNAQVEAGQMRQDGNGGFTMDIILSQVDAGLAGRMRQGKSQTMQYIEKTYGLGRAGVLARGRGRS